MRTLVLGGTGYLGRDLVDRWRRGHEVVAPSRNDCDLLDSASIQRQLDRSRFEVVINCVAMASLDACERAPADARLVNAIAPGVLAELCARAGVRLVHLSTDVVFDGEREGPYFESDEARPVNVYGTTKLAGERAVLAASGDALVVRTSVLMGFAHRGFVWDILQAAEGASVVRAAVDWVRCPTFTVDLVDALEALVQAGANGLIHVTNTGACSRYVQARHLLSLYGGDPEMPEPVAGGALRGLTACRPRHLVLESERLADYGLIMRPWQDAMEALIERLHMGLERCAE